MMNAEKRNQIDEINKELEVIISQIELSVIVLEEFFGTNEYFDGLKKDTIEKLLNCKKKLNNLKISEN
jgi:hypothetical protein